MTYIPKHRGEPKVVYRVHYVESERGWGRTDWDADLDTEDEAREAVRKCNADLPLFHAPDHYIVASYTGKVTL
jgi:hypothetical protein